MHIFVCVYVYVYACACVYTCMYVCMCVWVRVCMSVCACMRPSIPNVKDFNETIDNKRLILDWKLLSATVTIHVSRPQQDSDGRLQK